MAEKTALKDSLTCSLCLDTFREPVSLGCNHSFCCSCLQSYWGQSGTKNCPVCRRRWSKEFPPVNFALKQVVDAFAGRQETGLSEKSESKEEAVCSHAESQSLFCKDEGRLLCSVCEFYQHQRHTVVKVEEAEKELKEQLKSELETLSKQREEYKQLDELYEEITQHLKKQAAQCESQIKAVFNRLNHFLKVEEQRAVEALKKEQQRQAQTMSPELGRVRQQLASVNHSIQDVKELLQTDTKALLKTYNKTQRQVKVQTSQPNPKLASGLLIDQAKVLGNLGFRVWRRMRSEVSYSPVTLDPNTAHSRLYLSDDLRGVTNGDTYQKVPDNPERHTKYSSVLASEGFSSGVHQWDIEVGDLPGWTIGVAKESVDRKGERTASPENGIWCLWHGEGRYTNGCGKTLSVEKAPEKIRVLLNYDLGEVSFYDADHMTHLYTYKDTFTEKLFPYFSVGKDKDAKTKEIRISPSEASQSSPE